MNETPKESEEQAVFVDWLEYQGLKFTAIPNSTYTTSQTQKIKNYRQGLRPGLPDLLVIVKDSIVFVEMKRKKQSKVSDTQQFWIDALNKCDNVAAHVCYGADEAIETIKQYQ
jgi:hypothetical protein